MDERQKQILTECESLGEEEVRRRLYASEYSAPRDQRLVEGWLRDKESSRRTKLTAEDELQAIARAIGGLEGRFVESRALGRYLPTEHEAEFKRLVVEATCILDTELGSPNSFSKNITHTINTGSGGFLQDASFAVVRETRALIEGGVNQLRRKSSTTPAPSAIRPHYVHSSRIVELRSITSRAWDVSRLIRLCEELNIAHEHDCHMATAMLVRSIVDHVPPIFGVRTFNDVANQYEGAKSFRGSMHHLQQSLRNIADAHLHIQIRKTEVLPTGQQVDFRADLDVLLAEIVRIMK